MKILNCSILASLSNKIVNCNYKIKIFGLYQDFLSFKIRFIRILPQLLISVMEISFCPKFALSFFNDKLFLHFCFSYLIKFLLLLSK